MTKFDFLDNVEILQKVAIEKINKGYGEESHEIIAKLKEVFLEIIDLKDNNNPKYKILMIRGDYIGMKNPDEIPFYIREQIDRSIEGVGIFCDVFFNIFKQAYQNDLSITAENVLGSVGDILDKLFKKGKDYLTIAHYFIDLLQRMNILINQSSSKISGINHHVAYSWFFRLVFKDDFAIDGIDVAKMTLFNSIRNIINNVVDDIFISFVEYIHLGHYMPDFSLIPQLDFRTTDPRDKNVRNYEKLSNEFIHNTCNVLIYSDYLGSLKEVDKIRQAVDNLPDIANDVRSKLISKHEEYAKKMFKYNSLQQVVIWLGTYCVYKKKYNLIFKLFDFNQPHDSASTWTSQDINPLDYAQILTLFLRKDQLESDIWYRFGGHSDYSVYHKSFLALLFVNAVYRNSIHNSWRNEFNASILVSQKGSDYISLLIFFTTELRNIVNNFLVNDEIKSHFTIYNDSIIKAVELLNSFIGSFEVELNLSLKSTSIGSDETSMFRKTVFDFYNNGCSIKNIISHYNNVIYSEEYDDIDNWLFNSSNISIPNSFFSPTPGTMFVGFEQNFAKQLIFKEDIYLTKILVNSCKISEEQNDQSTIVKFIEDHGLSQDSVLIFVNIFPEYEIFNSKTEFKAREDIIDCKLLEVFEFVGKYKNADVFYISDYRTKRNVIFLNRSMESGLGTIQMFKLKDSEGFISESNLYFRIRKYLENPSLKDKILNNPPLWLIQNKPKGVELKDYIDTLVDIEIKYHLKYELPKDFEGWFIPLDN